MIRQKHHCIAFLNMLSHAMNGNIDFRESVSVLTINEAYANKRVQNPSLKHAKTFPSKALENPKLIEHFTEKKTTHFVL